MSERRPIGRAAVTGGGGFLGRYLVEQLRADGVEVTIFGRRDYPFARALGVRCVVGDLTQGDRLREAFRGADTVFHVAAIAGIAGPWQEYFATNTIGTRRVIEACRAEGIGRLVFTSSPSVTFDGQDQEGIDESVPYPKRFLCPYPHTKALGEQEVLAANQPGGLLTCALRPHLVWGPRDGHLLPRLVQRSRSGALRRVGDGRNRVDTIYVENAADAHRWAAEGLVEGSPVGGKAYFLSQGQPVNCWEWIDRLLALAGEPPVRRSIGYRTAWIAGSILERAYRLAGRTDEPRMTRFLAAQLATSHYYAIDAARHDFGFHPRVSTDEGLARYAAWLAEHPIVAEG